MALLGPAGSGKGSVGPYLAENLKFETFDSGGALRRVASQDTPLGRRLRERLDAGQMADTPLVMQVLSESIFENRSANGWILDGFPRNIEQARAVIELVRDDRLHLKGVILLDAPRSVLVERLLSRVSCKECGMVYNLRTRPPMIEDRCDRGCTGPLVRRNDDNPQSIAERFRLFDCETLPGITLLEAAGIPVMKLNADMPLEAVQESALQVARECLRGMERHHRGFPSRRLAKT